MKCKNMKLWKPVYDNNNDILIPELWANESLLILEENMVMANLVNRDFQNEIASFGEIVHTRRPNEFTAIRKSDTDSVTDQDTSSTMVNVALNQWSHTTFIIKDGERTKAFKDLIEYYAKPAMLAQARFLDQCLAAQAINFLGNSRGGLMQLGETTAKNYIIDMRDTFNKNKAYMDGRNLVLASKSESSCLKAELFIKANEVGDDGNAMRNAVLGKKFGFNTYMDINVPGVSSVPYTADTVVTAVPKGTTAQTTGISLGTGLTALGQYFVVAGDYSPLRAITYTTTSSTQIAKTSRPTIGDIAGSAVVQKFPMGTVNNASNYALGAYTAITVDGAGVPNVGQMVAFNDTVGSAVRTPEYMIVAVTGSGSNWNITLDRPLETVLTDNDVVCYGPNGDLNFAFHRNALSLVNRPLALPVSGLVRSANAEYNGLSMRVVITYDGKVQGHRVTMDSLFGFAVLDQHLGGVLLG